MSTLQTDPALSPAAPDRPSKVAAAKGGKKRKRPSFLLWFAIAWVVLIFLGAVFSDLLPNNYEDPIKGMKASTEPFASSPELLGTDGLGRSMQSRLARGGRVSLTVSVVSAGVGIVIGGILGLVAAYFRGWVETVIDIVADALLAFPPLILLLTLSSALKPSLTSITIGLAILTIPGFTRLTKANAIVQSNREYVLVAKAMGAKPGRIIFRELMPNTFPSVLSYSVIVMAVLIVAEGSLAFLGLGVPAPQPSWGAMIFQHKDNLESYPATVFTPAAVLFLTVFSLNVIGDRLRARFDVRESNL